MSNDKLVVYGIDIGYSSVKIAVGNSADDKLIRPSMQREPKVSWTGSRRGPVPGFASGSGHQCAVAVPPAEKNNNKEENGKQQYGQEKAGYGAEG